MILQRFLKPLFTTRKKIELPLFLEQTVYGWSIANILAKESHRHCIEAR